MIHFTKRTTAGFLVVILIVSMVVALPLAALGGEIGDGTGVYEGEYDANGKRSGYGTWTYHNYLYVGNWENDLPNGEGTLYAHKVFGSDEHRSLEKRIVQGNWVDGFADGSIEQNSVISYGYGNVITYRYDVKDGCIMSDEDIVSVGGYEYETIAYDIGTLIAAVPPWAPVYTDITIPAPSPTFEYDDDAETLVGITHEINGDGTGVYEGEYDADGKRSGYGTWAYHNFLYVGHWENDLPNGEGTLYKYKTYERDSGSFFLYKEMTHGNWVDGCADGAIEWIQFDNEYSSSDVPSIYIIDNVKYGFVRSGQSLVAVNMRKGYQLDHDLPVGRVPPWMPALVSDTDSTPWELYEQYPTGKVPYTPMEKIENTGMGVSPGNIGNGMGFSRLLDRQIAALGDWIFIATEEKENVYAIYKMRADGSQRIKIYESSGSDHFIPRLQVIGDWLFIDEPYKMRADDTEFTKMEGDYIWELVADDWEYDLRVDDPTSFTIRKTKLDYSEQIEMGSFAIDQRIQKATMQYPEIVFANEDWLYVYISNDGDWLSIPNSDVVSQIVKIGNSGTRQVQTYSFREGIVNPYQKNGMPQIIGGRMYYMESYIVDVHGEDIAEIKTYKENKLDRIESSLHSVDIDFAEAPVTLIPRNENQHITSFHVTEDSIYYGVVAKGTGRGAIMRADLDGGNAMVLAEGFETGTTRYTTGLVDTGKIDNLLIAGDWVMFAEYPTKGKTTWYLMRLDGSDLHKLGEPFVPSNAPGITDSTGKWRYELLADGSAMILGAGSKLKQTGKLSIPAMVDKIPVTAIGENAFYGCEDFTGVTIPKGVTRIGDYAFFWCKGLTGVTIPEGVTHIGEGAFQWCTKIKKVTLPASLTSAGSGAFANCPTVKLSVAKKNENFEIVDGALFDRQQNRYVD